MKYQITYDSPCGRLHVAKYVHPDSELIHVHQTATLDELLRNPRHQQCHEDFNDDAAAIERGQQLAKQYSQVEG